jgi:hypothetical protein
MVYCKSFERFVVSACCALRVKDFSPYYKLLQSLECMCEPLVFDQALTVHCQVHVWHLSVKARQSNYELRVIFMGVDVLIVIINQFT